MRDAAGDLTEQAQIGLDHRRGDSQSRVEWRMAGAAKKTRARRHMGTGFCESKSGKSAVMAGAGVFAAVERWRLE
ncbi:MAG: hypothetical protein IPL05_16180 [Betaproteobacteria bacterium]|nr:hypothetical protein [Betaproteobacteria bacterium]